MDRMMYEKKISKCFLGICQEHQTLKMLQKYNCTVSFKYILNKCFQVDVRYKFDTDENYLVEPD